MRWGTKELEISLDSTQAYLGRDPRARVRRTFAVIGSNLVAITLGWQAYNRITAPGSNPFGIQRLDVLALAVIFIVPLLVTAGVVYLIDARTLARQQRRYWSRVRPLTEEQQQMLALDAIDDYADGSWNSSLEWWPVERRLEGVRRVERRYSTLPIMSKERAGMLLDQGWGVMSRADVDRALSSAFAERSLSLALVDALGGFDADRVVRRLAALTGASEDEVLEYGRAEPDEPARLLWAEDVRRSLALLRTAYMAGVLEEDETWQRIESVAAIAGAVYPTRDEFVAGLRVARAFLTDSLEAVTAFDAAARGVVDDRWPAARCAMPRAGVHLPETVVNLRATRA